MSPRIARPAMCVRDASSAYHALGV